MSGNLHFDELLRAEAETVRVSPEMPHRVHRRIRTRQVGAAMATALSIAAAATFALTTPWNGDSVRPAEDSPDRTIATRRINGIPMRMEVRTDASNREFVCVVTPGQERCWGSDMARFGNAKVVVDYVRPLDRSVVIVRTPTGRAHVGIRPVPGPAYAAFWAPTGDDPSDPTYWYRFFPRNVSGILEIDGADAPLVEFAVKVRGVTVHTSLGIARHSFPELRGYPGDMELVASGPEGGGYSLIRRETDSLVCLHLGGRSRCRPAGAPVEPIRLALAHTAPCSPGDDCGRDQVLVIIGGEVSDEVARLGVQDDLGTSFVQVGAPADERHFATYIYGERGTELELIAFDADDEELERMTLGI